MANHDFENIINTLKVGVVIINYNDNFSLEYANDYLYTMLGYSRSEYEELYANSMTSRIYPDDIQKLKANLSRQLAMGGAIRYEFRMIKKDGSVCWISLNGTIHYSEKLLLRACLIDITESKALYNDKAEKNLELDTIYNSAQGGIIKISVDDFRVVTANDCFYDMIGYTKEEFLHKFNNIYTDLIYEKDLEQLHSLSDGTASKAQCTVRLKAKKNKLVWHMINASRIGTLDGKPLYLFTIIDVTESKTYQHKLELEQKKQRILANMSGEWVWEYDIATKSISHDTDSIIGISAIDERRVVDNYREYLLSKNIIHPDDISVFNDYINDMDAAKTEITYEFRVKSNHDDTYNWYKVMGTTLFDSAGTPLIVLGKTFNTNATHDTITALEEKTNKDALTQIFNRSAVEQMICDRMAVSSKEKQSALILADIDNFRSINDSLGHLFGDYLLIEAANIFKWVSPENSIVGRVGTDVFALFIENIDGKEQIDEMVDRIEQSFADIYNADKEEYDITCSIGISIIEPDDFNFDVEFKKADIALFSAKSEGKNIHKYYDPSLGFNNNNTPLNEYNMKESFLSLQASIDVALLTSAFDLMFEAKDTISATKILLSKMKDSLGADYVSLATIKESRNGNYSYKDIWIPSSYRINSKSVNIDKDFIEQHFSLFNRDQLFYCSDLNAIKTIAPNVHEFFGQNDTKSFLQCANINNGKFTGFVSLGTCSQTRSWSISEVRTFSILCKILFTVVGKLPIK